MIATETLNGGSLQRLVRRSCETCKHWSFREWVTPERGVCWLHYGIAKAADNGCDRWDSEARHSPPIERMAFSRVWSMPSADTFSVPQIGEMVQRYLKASKISCDPFARNKRWATYTNDLNPKTDAEYHMDAEDFLRMLACKGIRCDLAILDPPYSPRQISECYREAGIKCGMKETQNAALYSRVKNAMAEVLTHDAIVLSFGWNSAGMGQKHGFEQIELMLVCHGAAHNDTICLAERKLPKLQGALL